MSGRNDYNGFQASVDAAKSRGFDPMDFMPTRERVDDAVVTTPPKRDVSDYRSWPQWLMDKLMPQPAQPGAHGMFLPLAVNEHGRVEPAVPRITGIPGLMDAATAPWMGSATPEEQSKAHFGALDAAGLPSLAAGVVGAGRNPRSPIAPVPPADVAYLSSPLKLPPPQPRRPFEADYPNASAEAVAANAKLRRMKDLADRPGTAGEGAAANAAIDRIMDKLPHLTHTMDGDPIRAPIVYGRTQEGGLDLKATGGGSMAVAKALGIPVVEKQMPYGGYYTVEGFANSPNPNLRVPHVAMNSSLSDKDYVGILTHEILGHVGDLGTRTVGGSGVSEALLRYPELLAAAERNYGQTVKGEGATPAHPRDYGYDSPLSHAKELAAQAMQRYALDPNGIKTDEPLLAKAIRMMHNPSPMGKYYQFNANRPAAAMPSLAAASEQDNYNGFR